MTAGPLVLRPPGLAMLALLALPALAHALGGCLLPQPSDKGARIDESFQHLSPSPGGFFQLYWNSSGDSALAPERVPRILAALEAARAHYSALPGAWEIPLGPRPAYPVLVVRQGAPGATTLPFSDGGVDGLTWIQLDHDFGRWGGDADLLLDATCAHELFHAFQFALGADLRDLAFYEASAVWAEDQVYPDHDDWAVRYLPALLENLHEPLDHVGQLHEYGAGAVVKYLLAGEGDWSPCRLALQRADLQARCWTWLLLALGDGAGDKLAGCLAELLQAGIMSESGLWRVPELAAAQPVNRLAYPPLVPGNSVPPFAALSLPGLSWRALPIQGAGLLQVAGEGASLYMQRTGEADPRPLRAGDLTYHPVSPPDWLLLVNENGDPIGGLVNLDWQPPMAAPFRIWPNPGGNVRRVEFNGLPRSLVFHNLLGQEVGAWRPASMEPRQLLQLPPSARGALLVSMPGDDRALLLTCH